MKPIFITGIGTDVGKTIVSAIVTEALQADYWKPVQAGYDDGTDSEWVKKMVSNPNTNVYPEAYKFKMPASPHIAAQSEGVTIDIDTIYRHYGNLAGSGNRLVIEGAGGLLVPLTDKEFVIDLVKKLEARVIIVSRNYLGSINHSLLTAQVCKYHHIDVAGWVFNDNYMHYEEQIVNWSGYPKIGSVNYVLGPDKAFVLKNANAMRSRLIELL
ncbi:MAG TPA: dethiobiotin synthase [Chitinophagaceae bacterium]|nr:dethiobiotin synthase [Chitinophagaceae bacterium]